MIKQSVAFVGLLTLVGCGMHNSEYASGNKVAYREAPERVFPAVSEATGKKTFVFKPHDLAWAAYDEQGNRVKVGPAGGGVASCPETGEDCRTVRGVFQVQRKGGADCVSKKYPIGRGGAPMAYCMHFHEGYSIHGSPGVPNGHSSHGCIHLSLEDARWLNEDFLQVGSTVKVEDY